MSHQGERHRLCDAFVIVRSVIDSLQKKDELRFPVPILKPHGLLSIIEEQVLPTGIGSVDLLPHDWRSQQFHSALFRYDKHAEIHYSVHSSLDWRRLAICKEAMHLLIDDEHCHFTTDIQFLIEGLIVGVMFEPDTPAGSEHMGEVAAIEMLLPWKLRHVLTEMRDAGMSDFQIAVQTRVPVKYVTAMLHGRYGKASAGINEGLDNNQA